MAALREKAAELLMPEGLFSEAEQVTFLLVECLQGYGAKSPNEVGKQFESYLGVEPNAFRWVSIASSYFQSIESSKTLFEEFKTSLRWYLTIRSPSGNQGGGLLLARCSSSQRTEHCKISATCWGVRG